MAQTVDLTLATRPSDVEAVPGLVDELSSLVKNLRTGGDEARHDMLKKARALVDSLETPRETMIKHTWAQAHHLERFAFKLKPSIWSFNCPSRDPASPCLGLSALADTINCRILTEPLLQLPTTPLQGSQKKKSRPARTKSPKTVNGRVAPVQTPLPFTCSAVATNTKQANCPVELVPWRAGEQPVYH